MNSSKESRVLVVDDQPHQVRALCNGLSARGCLVIEVTDLEAARAALGEYVFDLIILDREILAEEGLQNGLELCREIREIGVSCRVVFYTNLVSAIDHREGWDSGADDYIEKAWPVEVALARCDAHLMRGNSPQSGGVKRYAHSALSSERHLIVDETALIVARQEAFELVRRGGIAKHRFNFEDREKFKKAKMTDLDLAVFFYLYSSPNEWVSEEELLREVWAYSDSRIQHMMENPDANSGLVHTTVARMRRKVDSRLDIQHDTTPSNARRPWAFLETSNQEGQTSVSYRFCASELSVSHYPVSPLI